MIMEKEYKSFASAIFGGPSNAHRKVIKKSRKEHVKSTQKKELPIEFKEKFAAFVKEQESLPADFIKIINDNFLDLI